MMRTPSISMTIVAWPRKVTRAWSARVTSASIVERAAVERRYHRDVVDLETIRSAPKVLLHDHLDGGLRPATVIELADETGYRDLPTDGARRAWTLVPIRCGPQVPRALPRGLRPHGGA